MGTSKRLVVLGAATLAVAAATDSWRLEVGSSSAVAVAHVGVRCAERSTCTLPRAVRLPASVAAGRRTVIVSAGKGQGMGRTEIVVDLGARPTGLAFTLRAG